MKSRAALLCKKCSCRQYNLYPPLSVLQMKEKYASEKPYGEWLKAQVATLPELVESVPEHLLKVPTIHSRHKPIGASPVAHPTGSNGSSKGQKANGSSDGQEGNGSSNGQGSNGVPTGSKGTVSSSQEGGQVGVNASNGHSNGGAGTCTSESTADQIMHTELLAIAGIL